MHGRRDEQGIGGMLPTIRPKVFFLPAYCLEV
jgi:hypothetical protein